MNSKPWLIHLSHEAVRPLGGVGRQIRQQIETEAIRNKFRNNIVLAGPLFFPEEGDCRSQTNLETLRILKRKLHSLIRKYPPPIKDNSIISTRFQNIEAYFNVYLYYYIGESPGLKNETTSLLLIDHSSVFGQNFMQSCFLNEVISKINFETDGHLETRNVHPNEMKLGERVRQELIHRHDSPDIHADLAEEMSKPIIKTNRYDDFDYILGLLVAEPLARAIGALCGKDDNIYVVANNYFGLPTLHQLKKERPNKTKTILHVTEVNPVRHLVEQSVPNLPRFENGVTSISRTIKPTEKDVLIGDSRFYNIMKSLPEESMAHVFNELGDLYKDASDQYARMENDTSDIALRAKIKTSADFCDKAQRALDISTHSSFQIFHLAKYVDRLFANGVNSREEILWLLRAPEDGYKYGEEVPIIIHGLPPLEESPSDVREHKLKQKRKVIARLNRTDGIYIESGQQIAGRFRIGRTVDYVFLKISRPVLCKAFDRDIMVCRQLDQLLKKNDKQAIFVIVSHWDSTQEGNPINQWIDITRKDPPFEAISFFFINQFDWPQHPDKRYCLSRESLLWATDVSFSQSRYESFGISQIEPLAYGTFCLVSSASGAYHVLQGHADKVDANNPVIFADYISCFADSALTPDGIFGYDWESRELEVYKSLATMVYEKITSSDVTEVYKVGRELLGLFDWERIAKNFVDAI